MAGIRVLALLGDQGKLAELASFDCSVCLSFEQFKQRLGEADFDVVILDTALGSGWPSEVAETVTDRVGRKFGMVILFGHASDVVVVDSRVNARDVWCLTNDALHRGDLTAIAEGLAALKRVRARSFLPN